MLHSRHVGLAVALEVEHQHDLVVPLAPAHKPGAERREAGLAPAIVILFGLAKRTARKSRKYHYFTELSCWIANTGALVCASVSFA